MDLTQETQMEVDEIHVDPFSRTRLGNESNPFVGDVLPVPDHSKVSVPDDSDDEQEFNERFV